MSPRIRRLISDYNNVLKSFDGHEYISISEIQGKPPERYIIDIKVKGLQSKGKSVFFEIEQHQAELHLPLDYPRRPPICRMLTPVFHPNIDPQKICIGDHWSAGESLPHLMIRIAEMICYQSYNTQSPLNAEAAAWAEINQSKLPLQEADLTVQ